MTIYLGDTITVKIIKGTNLIAADMNGKSDPYVVLDTSMDFNAVHKTAIIEKTLNPEWNDEFVIKNLYKETDSTFLFFNVWDWDRFTSDDEVSLLKISFIHNCHLSFQQNNSHFFVKAFYLGSELFNRL
ncbi:hypothetical protein ABK040_012290 [Willaertia magna]